jgi:hypothetical protein
MTSTRLAEPRAGAVVTGAVAPPTTAPVSDNGGDLWNGDSERDWAGCELDAVDFPMPRKRRKSAVGV